MGLAILFACTIASLAGGAACIFALARHGRRVLARALRAALGSVLVWSLAVLLLGFAEGVYSIDGPVAWVLAAVGGWSLWFIVSGVMAAAQPRLLPSQCRRCGYDMSGVPSAAVCPECGAAV